MLTSIVMPSLDACDNSRAVQDPRQLSDELDYHVSTSSVVFAWSRCVSSSISRILTDATHYSPNAALMDKLQQNTVAVRLREKCEMSGARANVVDGKH
jgi:hypothetical protein